VVPELYDSLQSSGQLMPSGSLTTLPTPVPVFVTVRTGGPGGDGGGAASSLAMVPTPSPSAMVARTALLSRTSTVSSGSYAGSPTTGTRIVADRCRAAKLTVPCFGV